MRYYPINLNLQGKQCVVFGGGKVAERKVARLLECGAEVVVVAPELTEGLAKLAEAKHLHHIAETYDEEQLEDAHLAIGATDDERVNAAVAAECEDTGILCNIVDDPARCSFTLPALVVRGEFCLAVSTGGKSPALAKRVRLELEKIYGQEYAVLVDLLGRVRDRLLSQEDSEEADRAEKFERLANSDLPWLIEAKDEAAIDALLVEVLGEGFSLTALGGLEGPGAKP
jgi:precorrin-2 dehydrogenase/sirohydrochlorin ferrochelatase